MDEPTKHTDENTPSPQSVRRYLTYGLSLPERALRTSVGLVGGVVRESSSLLVPQAFQDSKSYSVMVRQMLDYLVEDVGGVARRGDDAETPPGVENFVARKAIGNFIEMSSLATLHLSPITILAVVSDVAYGSQAYLRELSAELKAQGVIDENTTIDRADDLLAAIATASSTSASAFDTPPLSIDGFRQVIEETRASAARIDPASVIPAAEVDRLWKEIRSVSEQEGVGMIEVAGAATFRALEKIETVGTGALTTVRVAGGMFDQHVLDHYRNAIDEVRDRGVLAVLRDTSGPYIEAVWSNFSSHRTTWTERLASGEALAGTWAAARRWLGFGGPLPLAGGAAASTPRSVDGDETRP